MSDAGLQACPGCAVTPLAGAKANEGTEREAIVLSLPGIRCAGCISGVERALGALPGVTDARVNLTQKRVRVSTDRPLAPATLIETLADAGYEAHRLDTQTVSAGAKDRAGRELLMRMAVAGFAMMNIMLLSVAVWSGAEAATRDLFHWISAAIAFPAIAFAGQPFFQNAWTALRAGRLNMDVPITLAILLALGTSLSETIQSGKHAYFDAAVALTFFLLAGRYLDHRTRALARSAAQELTALEVPEAVRIEEQGPVTRPIAEIAVGDRVLVRPGDRVPVDGRILSGSSEVDRSLLTGESLPAQVAPGTQLSAGEVNLTGPLEIEVTARGADSTLVQIAELVAVAETARSRYTSLADEAAKLYAPGVHILAALAAAGWLIGTGDGRVALNIAAAVLIITCPCALGLAVPAVRTAASGRLFRQGVLIKDGSALERLAEVDTVVFDKTGTLTEGAPEPIGLDLCSSRDLAVAAGLATGSAHPLARALCAGAADRDLAVAEIADQREVPGFGTEGLWEGRKVRLGRLDWAAEIGGEKAAAEREIGEATATVLAIEGVGLRPFLFTDRLRPGTHAALEGLRAQGLDLHLLSGDRTAAVSAFADSLDFETWTAGARPDDKAAYVERLRAEGRTVLMVGDGLNDTAALAGAHVSISPASALDAARVASDIVLLGRDLSVLPEICRTARVSVKRMKENFQLATVYNVLAVPLAVAGLATPLIAALAMSASSITVSLNAIRLR